MSAHVGRRPAACGGRGYWRQRADVIVVGTGVAGLAAALAAHALRMDAGNEEAQETLRVAGNLDESGFREGEAEGSFYEASPLAPADPWRAER